MTEDELLALVASLIGSVWALELLLLLRRASDRVWEPDTLVRELRSSRGVIDDSLRRLQSAGLVVQTGGATFRYHAISPTLDEFAREIEKVYATKPTTVIAAIVNANTDKLRVFSDAFKLKD